jgi:hypothetical protein
MSVCYTDTSPRNRWREAYHKVRLLRRQARENRLFKAHFWQAALGGILVFWAVVAVGIHSL